MSSHVQDAAPTPDHSVDNTPGARLRQAREAAGLSVAEAAEQLRLRTALVDAMERGDLAALGAPIFARGYLGSYARLLDLPAAIVDELYPREEVVAAAPLRSSSRISHGRFLLDRYARRLVYVALTASIVVPVILLATRDHLPDPAALLAPLDESMALDGDNATIQLDPRGQLARRSDDMGPPAPSEQPV
ncbi:MAG: helix-turn-helix domain-containing protein, partial [Gammaproteobacteria bacterium]|nr:helix-turn-helix domain-containing protein [Gammaproteobacteria bacterium]